MQSHKSFIVFDILELKQTMMASEREKRHLLTNQVSSKLVRSSELPILGLLYACTQHIAARSWNSCQK